MNKVLEGRSASGAKAQPPAATPSETGARGIPPDPRNRTWVDWVGRYGLAIAAVALATVVRGWLGQTYDVTATFIVHYPAVLLVASVAGGGPGVLATVLSTLAVDYWFLPPLGTFSVASVGNIISLSIFTAAGLLLSLLAERLRRSRWATAAALAREVALREMRDRLEDRVRERTMELEQTNRSLQDEVAERQRAEQAVRDERQRLNNVLEMLPAYVVLLAPDYHVPFANRYFEERFGASRGRCCFDYLFQRAEPCENCETYKVLDTHAPHHWEWTGPDGRDYDVHDFPFTDTNGAPLIMEMGIDVTERKQAQRALAEANRMLEQRVARRTAALAQTADRLRDSEERLQFALETAHIGAWDLDLVDHGAFRSLEHERIFGYDRLLPEWTYEKFLEHVVPEDRAAVDEKFQQAVQARGEWGFECRIRRADGQQRWIWAAGRHRTGRDGAARRMAGIVQDITERKQAEEEVRRGRQTFSELVERAPFGIYVVDAQFRIAHMNAGSQTGAFRNVRPVIGRDFSEAMRTLWPESVAAEIIGHFRHTLETGEPYYSPRFINPRHDVDMVESYEWELHRMTLPDGQYGVICYYFDSTKLREAEAKLRQSEELLRMAQQIAGVGSFEWNIVTGVNTWTAELEAMYGLSAGGFAGTQDAWEKLIHPEDRARATGAVQRAFETQGGVEEEWRVIWPDGSLHWLAGRFAIIRDQAGKPLRLTGVNFDITERKAAEEAVQRSEALLRAVLDNSPDPIFLKDRECRLLLANPATFALIGKPAKACLGKTDAEFYDDVEAGRAIMANDRRIMASGCAEVIEEQVTTAAGARTYLSAKGPFRDAEGRVIGLVGVARDITDRKAVEEAKRVSEQRLIGVLESMPDAFVSFDNDMRYTYVNANAERIQGVRREELLGKDVRAVYPDAESYKTISQYERVLREQKPVTMTSYHAGFDSWVEIRAFPTPDGVSVFYKDVSAQVKAEQALRESEVRFRLALRNAPVSVAAQDRELRYIWAYNQRTADPEEIIGHFDGDLFSAEQADRLTAIKRRVLDEGMEEREQMWLTRPGGDVFLDICWEPIRDESGRVTGVASATVDLTPIKRAEEQLRRQTARLEEQSRIADLASLFIRDLDGRVVYWNSGTQQLYGYTKEEAVGVESQKLLQTVFPVPLAEIEAAVFREGRWEGELVHTRCDGTKLTVFSVWILHRDAEGRPQAILEANNDVTAVRKAEEARREAEAARRAEEDQRRLSAYHRSLIEASLDPLVTIDAAGKITDANAAAERVTGVARADLIGTDFSSYFTEPDLARAGYEQVFREGSVQDYALEVRHRDGRRTPVLYNASVFRDAAGEVLGVFAAARDITVRRQIEEALRRLNDELEARVAARTADLAASNKELEAFAYSVSHDLRAPLRAIDGFSQALLEDYGDTLDLQGRSYLQRARTASQRMGQLIDGILRLSRTSRVEMRRIEMNMSVLAKAIAADLKRGEPEREVEFAIVPNLYVSADASLLRAALQNLLENAWKFTSKHPAARIEVGVTQRDNETVFFVRDDGAGFDMAYAEKLFGAFQRLHGHSEFEGTGVGLATVQRIIHRHGGRVWAEGQVEHGATFYFTLPTETRRT